MHVAYASRHVAYPLPILDTSEKTAVARALPARATLGALVMERAIPALCETAERAAVPVVERATRPAGAVNAVRVAVRDTDALLSAGCTARAAVTARVVAVRDCVVWVERWVAASVRAPDAGATVVAAPATRGLGADAAMDAPIPVTSMTSAEKVL